MIIDNENQFQILKSDIINSDIVLIPVYSDIYSHPQKNSISLFHIYSISSRNEYTILINHSELIYKCDIIELFRDFDKKIYVPNKKQLFHFYELNNVIDIGLISQFMNKKMNNNEINTEAHLFFKRNFYTHRNINQIIPVVKHIFACHEELQHLLKIIAETGDIIDSPAFKIYNDILLFNYYSIEKSGINIDRNIFKQYFEDKSLYHLGDDNLIYSDYNVYTRTGRPSNSFAGINFAAMNKDDGTRSMIRSRFVDGLLVELDFNSFHMFLVSKLIGYKFPTDDIHLYLASQMLGTNDVTDEEKVAMKQLNFELLYSDLDKTIIDNIPFYKSVHECRNKLYHDFRKNGYIETFLFKRKLFMPSDSKLATVFNYYIQSYETEQNAIFIRRILQYIEQNNILSRLILYTYDSFLFDIKKDELNHLMNILSLLDNDFPIKISAGYDYSNLIRIEHFQKI